MTTGATPSGSSGVTIHSRTTWTAEEEQQGCDLYGVGFTRRQVGEYLGRPDTTVQSMLKRNKVRMRPRGRIEGSQVTVTHEEIVRAGFLYERMGMSTHEVAQAMGLSYTPTRNRLLLAGVQFRTKKQAQRVKAERRKAMA